MSETTTNYGTTPSVEVPVDPCNTYSLATQGFVWAAISSVSGNFGGIRSVNKNLPDQNNNVNVTSISSLDYSGELSQINSDLTAIANGATRRILTDIDKSETETFIRSVSGEFTSKFDVICSYIPEEASSVNKLADKSYVRDEIRKGSSTFRGNWSSWSEVPSSANEYPPDEQGNRTPKTNDFITVNDAYSLTFISEVNNGIVGRALAESVIGLQEGHILTLTDKTNLDIAGIKTVNLHRNGSWRFVYVGVWDEKGKSGWNAEYALSYTSFTDIQWAAINSGINDVKVSDVEQTSGTWDKTYFTVASLSSDWENATTEIESTSSNSRNVYATVQTASGKWERAFSATKASSANWQNATAEIESTSANNRSVYGTVNELSGNWSKVYSTVQSASGKWERAFSATKASSANWQNATIEIQSTSADNRAVYSTVNSASAGWENARSEIESTSANNASVYTTVNSTSSDWENASSEIESISANSRAVYSTVNSTSADWENATTEIESTSSNNRSVYTSVNSTSSNWDNVYSTVSANSGNWDEGHSIVSVSGRWENASVEIEATSANNRTVYTTVNSASSEWERATTEIQSTSANNRNVYTTVNTASSNWENAYSTVNSVSANWQNATTEIESTSANNRNVYSTVNATSGDWNNVYSTVNEASGDWENATTKVESSSSNWDNAYSSLNSASAEWNSVYSSVNSVSANWENATTKVSSSSADWDSVYSSVNSTSSDWNNVYTSVNSASAGWENARSEIESTSANNRNVYSTVNATSGDWNNVYVSVNAASAQWENSSTKVSSSSANWDSVYASVNSASAGWENARSEIESISSDSRSVYGIVQSLSSDWQSNYTTVSETSGKWETVYTTVNENSGNWNSAESNAKAYALTVATSGVEDAKTFAENITANINKTVTYFIPASSNKGIDYYKEQFENPENGDVIILKKELFDSLDKYKFTSFTYSNEVWMPMNGDYTAETVFFTKNLTSNFDIGNVKIGESGFATISASGRNIAELFNDIFVSEKPPIVKNPDITLYAGNIGNYESGMTVTPYFKCVSSKGTYSYGPISNSIFDKYYGFFNGETVESTQNNENVYFTGITLTDSMSSASDTYVISSYGHFTDDDVIPVSNNGNPHPELSINAGNTLTKVFNSSSNKVYMKSFRQGFYGSKASKSGTVDSTYIRTVGSSSGEYPTEDTEYELTYNVGDIRAVFAYPSAKGYAKSIMDRNGLGANIINAFDLSTVEVYDYSGSNPIPYFVYIKDASVANDTQNTYTLKFKD